MEKIISIRDAAKMLGVTMTTLRRWDKSNKLKSIRAGEKGHRYYKESDMNLFINDLPSIARDWASNTVGHDPDLDYYCQNSSVFQDRLTKMDKLLFTMENVKEIHSLLVAITGEIGSNSFDHNLGNWPDTPGIFFAYDLSKKNIVLADRGVGILATLKRVRPKLASHEEALKVAFTERITGRAPESRGNGLKFVRKAISEYPLNLEFETGDVKATIGNKNTDLNIIKSNEFLQGCFALIRF